MFYASNVTCGNMSRLLHANQMKLVASNADASNDRWFKYEKELPNVVKGLALSVKNGAKRSTAKIVRLCRLDELLDCHSYDLSGGEQQRAALRRRCFWT